MSQTDSRSIRINLEISVPVGGEVQLQQTPGLPKKLGFNFLNISHPNQDGDTTFAKAINDGTRNYICAKGQSEAWHVFAKVYDGDPPPGDLTAPPLNDLSIAWTRPDSSQQWTFPLLLVPGPLGAGNKKTLVVWEEATNPNYTSETRTFFASATTYTYCDMYGGMTAIARAAKPAAKDWSTLPERWQFHLAGVSNASSPNCGCLNGSWLLKRDGQTLWTCKVNTSFADPQRFCWWRLSFNHSDGFWYLECVGDPQQPVGVSIAYRRHESVFDPCGANEMALLNCHGYCHVPDFVTLSPA